MIGAVYRFCERLKKVIAKHNAMQRVADRITVLYSQIDGLQGNQYQGVSHSRRHTTSKQKALKTLRENLNVIIQAARFIARRIPEFDKPFQLPKTRGHEALLYTARNFVEFGAAHADEFS